MGPVSTAAVRALAALALALSGCGFLISTVRDAVDGASGGGGGELLEGQHARGSTSGGGRAHAISCGAASQSPQRVYEFTAPRADVFVFDSTTSDYDGVLAIYDAHGSELGCNDDHGGTRASQVTLSLSEGDRVRVVQGGYSGRAGHYELWVQGSGAALTAGGPRPPAAALQESTQTSGDTAGLASIPGLDCPPAGPMQEWTFTPSADGSYLVQVDASYDAYLGVFAAQDSISLACNDDSGGSVTRSRAIVPMMQGSTYRVVVGGAGGQSGTYVLSAQPMPTSTALRVDRPLFFEGGGTDDEPNLCGVPDGSVDRSFVFSPPGEAFYSIYADTMGTLVVSDGRRVIACLSLDPARRAGLLLKGGHRYRLTLELSAPDGQAHAMLVQRVRPDDADWRSAPLMMPAAP